MKIEQLKAYGQKALIVSFSSTDTPYKDVVRLQDFARHLQSKKALELEDILISHFNLNLVFQKPILVAAVSPQLVYHHCSSSKNKCSLGIACVF